MFLSDFFIRQALSLKDPQHGCNDSEQGLREGWDGMAQIMDDVTSLEINSNTGADSQIYVDLQLWTNA